MPKVKRRHRYHLSASLKRHYEHAKWKPLQSITNQIDPIFSLGHINTPDVIAQLPQWHISSTTNCIKLSLLTGSGSGPSVVKFSVTVCQDLRWSVRVYGRVVPSNSDLYTLRLQELLLIIMQHYMYDECM